MDDFNEEELNEEELENQDSIEQIPEPPEDTPENIKGNMVADTKDKVFTAIGSKKLLHFY